MDIKKFPQKLKLKKKGWLIILATTLIVSTVGYTSKYWLGDDNFIEQKCEQIIENNTGFDLDLSPRS